MRTSDHHPFRSPKAKAKYLSLYDEAAKDWPVTSDCKMVDTSYGQTFVRISGPVDAPPLVLLPGAGGCSLMWKPNIESLSKHYRAYAVDALANTGCYGRSVYTQTLKSSQDAVIWLDDLFSNLALGNSINLVGMSYGGWLTSQYMLYQPSRLDKTVLLAPAATVLPVRWEFTLYAILLGILPIRYSYRCFCSWIFSDLTRKNPEMMEAGIGELMTTTRCFKPAKFPRLTVLKDEEFQSIKTPTLFLVGENEVLYSAQKAIQRLNTVAPQIRAEIVPKAGHDLTLVQPDMVNQRIIEFLTPS